MKKLTLYLLLIGVCGCGVPKSEHFALKIENEKLQANYDYLEQKYDDLKKDAMLRNTPTKPRELTMEALESGRN